MEYNLQNCESLCCTPETYIILYINCTLIKKQKQKNIAQTNVKKLLPYVRERQISYAITYMWNLKKGTNELILKQK